MAISVGGVLAWVLLFLWSIRKTRRADEIEREINELKVESERLKIKPYDEAQRKLAEGKVDSLSLTTRGLLIFLLQRGRTEQYRLEGRYFSDSQTEFAKSLNVLEREGLIERSDLLRSFPRADIIVTHWTLAPTFEALLRSWKSKHAILMPEAQWKRCERCKIAVPEFEFSESFDKEISSLLRTTHPDPAPVMHRLHPEGYEFGIAKAWALHHGPYKHKPCPWCGKPLRTNKAKQCRFCGKDWH